MNKPARLFNCISCQTQVIVCSHCDFVQRYCSQQCSKIARQISHRAADARYQKTRRGRFKHAERQSRYRQRQRQKQKIVTDHTSLENDSHDVLPVEQNEEQIPQTARLTEEKLCHFCKKPVSDSLRRNFLGPNRGIINRKIFRRKNYGYIRRFRSGNKTLLLR